MNGYELRKKMDIELDMAFSEHSVISEFLKKEIEKISDENGTMSKGELGVLLQRYILQLDLIKKSLYL